jgi:DNA-binding SARP family transcriptional activator
MPPTAPAPGRAPLGATGGAATTEARDAASRLAASGRGGGHRRPRWRHHARSRPRVAQPGQHRANAAAPGRRLRAAADVAGAAVLLAGLPWGLGRLAGPPLPGHWAGWQQVREFAASPLSHGAVIKALAGAAWLAWAVFAVAVIAEVTAAACGRPVPRLPPIAPVQALAATLAGTIVITALHLPRTAARAAQVPHAVPAATVTTAGSVLPGGAADSEESRPYRAAGISGRAQPDDRIHTVVAGDNLWDLARTYLGSGERWHEIYDLNRGRPQPGGGTLTDPARIYPGWDLLIPVAGPHPPYGRGNPHGGGRPARHRRRSAPAAVGSPGPARSTLGTGRPGARQHVPPPWVRLPSGALIGLGTAVVVSTAVALARVHRRRRYRPGTVLTSSLEPAGPPPPVISALDRAARTHATGTPAADGIGSDLDLYEPHEQPFPGPRESGAAAPAPDRLAPGQPPAQHGTAPAPAGPVPIGIRGGQEITADPAALGGLGLTGPGAPAAARAILAALLARPPRGQDGTPAQVIIPAADAARLLPGPSGQWSYPAIRGVSVPPALDAALDEAEAMIVGRIRTAHGGDADPQPAAVVLAAAPGPAAAQRLAAITDAGRDLGVAVVLLGAWPHGTTCHITADGLIASATPPQADLAGTEAYHLEAGDLAAIIAQLGQASENSGDDGPAAPGPPETAQPHPLSPAAAPEPGGVTAPRRPRQQPPPPAGTAGQSTGSAAAGTPVQISVLGPLRITAAGREIGTGLRKARELLAFLAVAGAGGATAEAISEALWPGSPPGHSTRQRNVALRKARELLRGATGLAAPMWINLSADRYRLDPSLINVDLWQFQAALEAVRTAGDDQARLAACQQAAGLYRGPLADGAGYEWAEPYAETARRRALDAYARIAEILKAADPEQALASLEAALTHDPYNEYTYQQIMRLQARARRPDAVRRTLQLLEARLGELGVTPAASTRQLAATLLGTTETRHAGGDGNGGSPSGRQGSASPDPGQPAPRRHT